MDGWARPIRYQQVMKVLEARIVSGLYPVGALLPSEAELCREFSISRYTIREALRHLSEKALIKRRKGSGSLVSANTIDTSYSLSLRSLSEILHYALDTHYQLLRIEELILDAETARALQGEIGQRWTVLVGARSISKGQPPFSYVRSCVPERLAWIAPELPGCIGPFFAHIEKRINEPIVTAEQDIGAMGMPADIAATLGCEPGTIGLLLLRRYMSTRGTLIASYNWHVASEFTYHMTLQKGAK